MNLTCSVLQRHSSRRFKRCIEVMLNPFFLLEGLKLYILSSVWKRMFYGKIVSWTFEWVSEDKICCFKVIIPKESKIDVFPPCCWLSVYMFCSKFNRSMPFQNWNKWHLHYSPQTVTEHILNIISSVSSSKTDLVALDEFHFTNIFQQ